MRLDDIGFYTLTEKRAQNVTWDSRLERCEVILTDACNFRCPYCRGVKEAFKGSLTLEEAKEIVDIFASGQLRNIRFSGGEPTVWPDLVELVRYTKTVPSIEHIALSTNGSASIELYLELLYAGVNDFSISFDACCSSQANQMAGVDARYEHLLEVIRFLSSRTYVTVGVVLHDGNKDDVEKIIATATDLGVSDIRIIPSAQSNHALGELAVTSEMPILNYRINNIKLGKHVRGIGPDDTPKCHLVKDDMVVLHGEHFPCVIYMREGGESLGTMYGKSLSEIRKERKQWFDKTDCSKNPICRKNCLDVCVHHNNTVSKLGAR